MMKTYKIIFPPNTTIRIISFDKRYLSILCVEISTCVPQSSRLKFRTEKLKIRKLKENRKKKNTRYTEGLNRIKAFCSQISFEHNVMTIKLI